MNKQVFSTMANGHGGARKGAGRKPKADEQKLIELLDKHIDQEEVILKLKELALTGDKSAITLYMNYRYGKPSETKNISIDSLPPIFGAFDEEE